jgi:3-deoxy-D-manno-oct-2-ulosonic acid (Kdo) hydroxylase
MTEPEAIESLPIAAWHGPFEASSRDRAQKALEAGRILLLPRLPFLVAPDETDLLDPAASGSGRKNISLDLDTGDFGNAALDSGEAAQLKAMMARFAEGATRLVKDLVPGYAEALERARTSFRPVEIAGRDYSPRHDDRRLHIDAFPSRPMQGRRILRLFSNIAPDGAPRLWRVGEPFADVAAKLAGRAAAPWPGSAWALERLGVTKGRRSAYDHVMLRLHDGAKLDDAYQASAPKVDLSFAPGTTWLCFTDQVMHAALAGHAALEQTFHLPIAAMAEPATSPLRVLERLTGRALV